MAKKSKIAKNNQRKKTVAKYAEKRATLKEAIRSPKSTEEEREEAKLKLQKLPRDANPIRVRNRCTITGRSRGYISKFAMSRIAFRKFALRGEIPGVTKASW